jgi:V8-like Glu-specific endopeptidase
MFRTYVKRYQLNKLITSFIFFVFLITCLIGLTVALIDGNPIQTGRPTTIGSVISYNCECTGTLIQGDLVLTAGHCVCNDKCKVDSGTSSCHKNATFILHDVKIKNESYQNYPINGTVWVNPNYGNGIDLALIKLDMNASQIANVEPILIEHSYDALLGKNISIIGFENGPCCEVEETKMKRQLHPHKAIISLPRRSIYERLRICPGDSGAPVLNDDMHVIGVVTKGPKKDYINCNNPASEMEFKSIIIDKTIYDWIYNYSNQSFAVNV